MLRGLAALTTIKQLYTTVSPNIHHSHKCTPLRHVHQSICRLYTIRLATLAGFQLAASATPSHMQAHFTTGGTRLGGRGALEEPVELSSCLYNMCNLATVLDVLLCPTKLPPPLEKHANSAIPVPKALFCPSSPIDRRWGLLTQSFKGVYGVVVVLLAQRSSRLAVDLRECRKSKR